MQKRLIQMIGTVACGGALVVLALWLGSPRSISVLFAGSIVIASGLLVFVVTEYEQRYGRARRMDRLTSRAFVLATEGDYESALECAVKALSLYPAVARQAREGVNPLATLQVLADLICRIDPIIGNGNGLAVLAQTRPSETDDGIRVQLVQAQEEREIVDAILLQIAEKESITGPELTEHFPQSKATAVASAVQRLQTMHVLSSDGSRLRLGPAADNRVEESLKAMGV